VAVPSAALRAILLGNIVGFGAMTAVDLWGSLSGGRPVMKVFAVIHMLFTVAFILAARRSAPPETR
jgi:hypothetical protein